MAVVKREEIRNKSIITNEEKGQYFEKEKNNQRRKNKTRKIY